MRADRHDQARALVVGEQDRDVLAGAGRGEDHGLLAELLDPLEARRAAVAVGVHDQLGAAAQRALGDRVEVAHDEVGQVTGLHQGVGAAVHTDQDRAVLPDVGAEGGDVLLVVVAAHHDQDVPALHGGADVGHPHAVDEQVALAADVLHGVHGEVFDLDRQARPRLGHRGLDVLGRDHLALADELLVEVDLALVDAHHVAVAHAVEDLGGGAVDERHPGVHQDLRAEVGIAPADARRDVHHDGNTARDKSLRAHPVDVDVIDDRDFPGPEALGQPLGPPIDPRHCRHPGKV